MKNLTIAALAMLATNSAYANQSDLYYFIAHSTVDDLMRHGRLRQRYALWRSLADLVHDAEPKTFGKLPLGFPLIFGGVAERRGPGRRPARLHRDA